MPTNSSRTRSTLIAYAAIGVASMPVAQLAGDRLAALFCIVAVFAIGLYPAHRS
jgi:hypothetical protein